MVEGTHESLDPDLYKKLEVLKLTDTNHDIPTVKLILWYNTLQTVEIRHAAGYIHGET